MNRRRETRESAQPRDRDLCLRTKYTQNVAINRKQYNNSLIGSNETANVWEAIYTLPTCQMRVIARRNWPGSEPMKSLFIIGTRNEFICPCWWWDIRASNNWTNSVWSASLQAAKNSKQSLRCSSVVRRRSSPIPLSVPLLWFYTSPRRY